MIINPPFYKDYRAKMIFALDIGSIPDKLSPVELDILIDLVREGAAGNGKERREKLGSWYPIIQSLVNHWHYGL